MWSIVVHGGAGSQIKKEKLSLVCGKIEDSVLAGSSILASSGNALDAVEEAVKVMEDSTIFNAGRGSNPNLMGEIEMDASIMDGANFKAGAVANVKRIRNPVSAARLVMEKTDHVLLVGEWATKFALSMGLKKAKKDEGNHLGFEKMKKKFIVGKTNFKLNLELYKTYPDLFHGTVGATALDKEGHLASATSTGGLLLKLPGRVGDTPIIGAGTYADKNIAVSATGIGEYIMLVGVGVRAAEYSAQGLGAADVAVKVIDLMTSFVGKSTAGIIIVDKYGAVGMHYNTLSMPRGYQTSSMKVPTLMTP